MRQVLYEDGSVGYVADNQRISLQAPDGGEIKEVSSKKIKTTKDSANALHERSKREKAVRKAGRWVVEELSVEEQVDKGIISESEAREIIGRQRRK